MFISRVIAKYNIVCATDLKHEIEFLNEIATDGAQLPEPANVYDRIKEALMLEVLWHKSDELQRKKILFQYKKLDMIEILAYMYVVVYHFAYMQKGKGDAVIDSINKIKKNHDFLSEMYALTISLNSIHHYGKLIPDYVGILSNKELDDLSNIPEDEIKDYAKTIKINATASITAGALLYHGTNKELEIGRLKNIDRKWRSYDKKDIPEPFWLSPSLAFAKLHGSNVYACKLHLPSAKIFGDRPYLKEGVLLYKDAAINEGKLVYDALDKGELFSSATNFERVFSDIISEDFDVIETKEFIDWAKTKGFGAAYVQGDGPRNLMVFDPTHVEIMRELSDK